MRKIGEADKAARIPISVPFFYGWFIVALSFLAATAIIINALRQPLWAGAAGDPSNDRIRERLNAFASSLGTGGFGSHISEDR